MKGPVDGHLRLLIVSELKKKKKDESSVLLMIFIVGNSVVLSTCWKYSTNWLQQLELETNSYLAFLLMN